MSFLARAFRRDEEERSTVDWKQYLEWRWPQTASGVAVSDESALRHSAVFACQRLIAGTIASLPVDVFRGSEPVSTPPLVVRRPSVQIARRTWVWQVASSLVSRGNAYGIVAAIDPVGRPSQIEIIDPAQVSWHTVDGSLVPYVAGVREDVFPVGRLWHIAGWTPPGSPVGMNPIEYARESIGSGLAAQQFGNRFFAADAHPTGLLETDQRISADDATVLKERFKSAVKGRDFAVLGQGATYRQVQISPEDSQFLDLMRFTVEEVCRFYGVAPEMIGAAASGASITYANREQRVQDLLMFGLGPWIDAIEQAWSAVLPAPQQVKFNTGGLLRADIKARFEVYNLAADIEQKIGQPVLLASEMRELENLTPLPDAVSSADE